MKVPNPPGSGKDTAEAKGVHREVESEERILVLEKQERNEDSRFSIKFNMMCASLIRSNAR